jgi:CheY-like chemotaxis protein
MPLSEAAPEPQAQRVRILVVEDEPLIRFGMSEALRDLGVAVVEASSADEAWTIWRPELRLTWYSPIIECRDR